MAEKFTNHRKHPVKFCRACVLYSPSEDETRQSAKYNRKFSAKLKRFECWHNITENLSRMNSLTTPFDGASTDNVKAMNEIHRLMQECLVLAEDRLKEARINDRILW